MKRYSHMSTISTSIDLIYGFPLYKPYTENMTINSFVVYQIISSNDIHNPSSMQISLYMHDKPIMVMFYLLLPYKSIRRFEFILGFGSWLAILFNNFPILKTVIILCTHSYIHAHMILCIQIKEIFITTWSPCLSRHLNCILTCVTE